MQYTSSYTVLEKRAADNINVFYGVWGGGGGGKAHRTVADLLKVYFVKLIYTLNLECRDHGIM